MNLQVEQHDGALWLVGYETPGAETCVMIARFNGQPAADIWKAAFNKSMLFAREMGRSGI